MQIECKGLTKRYDGKTVIQDLDWEIREGDFWCVQGPSGIGKTTLLRLILGLEKPDCGVVQIAQGLRFAPVFQEDRLLVDRTALENCSVFTDASFERIRAILNELLDEVDALTKPIKQLSGGMRRRVTLARALLSENNVLCLDEPFAGLDSETRERAWMVLERWRNGRTVIFVSHEFKPEHVKYLDLI